MGKSNILYKTWSTRPQWRPHAGNSELTFDYSAILMSFLYIESGLGVTGIPESHLHSKCEHHTGEHSHLPGVVWWLGDVSVSIRRETNGRTG